MRDCSQPPFVIAGLVLAWLSGSGVRADDRVPPALVPGATLAGTIAAGEVHHYRLDLGAGQYVRVIAAQRGIDLVLVAQDAEGRPLAETNFRATSDGNEWVSLAVDQAGTYRITLRPRFDAAPAGRYELKLTGPRPASESDRNRVRAERAFEEALRMAQEGESQHEAIAAFTRASELYAAAGDRAMQARTLGDMGNFHRQRGHTAQALECYARSLPLRRAVQDVRGEAMTLTNLGRLHVATGQAAKAVELLPQALTLFRGRGDGQGEGLALMVLGDAHRQLGDYQAALDVLRAALAANRQSRDPVTESGTLSQLGLLHFSLGETGDGVRYLLEARALHRKLRDRAGEAITLVRLASAHRTVGEGRKALAAARRAADLSAAVGNTVNEAAARCVMAELLLSYGRSSEALRQSKTAAELAHRASHPVNEAAALCTLAGLSVRQGDFGRARQLLEQARSLAASAGNTGSRVAVHLIAAQTLRNAGDLEGAARESAAALLLVESSRERVSSADLRATYLSSTHEVYEAHVDVLMRRYEREPAAGHVESALETLERGRARALVELVTEGRLDIRGTIDPTLRQRERDIHARLSWIQGRLSELRASHPAATSEAADLETELESVERGREQVEEEVRRRHPRYAEIRYPAPLRLPAIQALLDDDAALLTYSLGETSYVFAVSSEGVTARRLPPADEIGREVARLRLALRAPHRLRRSAYLRSARRLYEMVVAPVAAAVEGKPRLLVAPEGVLGYVPFEVLLTGRSDPSADDSRLPYLIRRWEVSYVPSATVLASLREPQPSAAAVEGARVANLVVFADPAAAGGATERQSPGGGAAVLRSMLDDVGLRSLPPLPAARREADGIRRIFAPDSVALYLGEDATEEALKTAPEVSTARRLHIATHALVSAQRPARSALVLSRRPDSAEDGLLQAFELIHHKIQADLVVLSACETGLGRELKGEGLIGLTRGFFYAGASSVVASLWPVADASTADLMIGFYRHLDRVPGRSDALRQAKLELIEGGRFAHPYYWAPFVLVGEP